MVFLSAEFFLINIRQDSRRNPINHSVSLFENMPFLAH